MAQHALAEQSALADKTPLQELRVFPDVARFVAAFERHRRRRPIMVLVGGTHCGKRRMATRILKQAGERLGLARCVEVTVDGDTTLDFSAC